MEDRVTVWQGAFLGIHHASLYAVYDGHGSQAVSQRLSEELDSLVVQEIEAYGGRHQQELSGINYTMVFEAAFERVDRDITAQSAVPAALEAARAQGLSQGGGSDAAPDISSSDDPGSTAVLALLLHHRRALVVANVGNSRALLCSSSKEDVGRVDRSGSGWGALRPVALSRPHELWQPDERERVLKAGAMLTGASGKVPRLEGDLELSRAFGDLRYRHKGLIAVPEVQGPRVLDEGDRFLILASDGIFEVMDAQELCAHAHAVAAGKEHPAPSPPRPPAIPLHPSTPHHNPHTHSSIALRAAVEEMLSSCIQFTQGWGTWLLGQVWGPSPSSAPGAAAPQQGAPGLAGCCDCGAQDVCPDLQQGATGSRRPHVPSRGLGPPPPSALSAAVSQRLLQEAFNRGSMDNLAVLVVDLGTVPAEPEQGSCGSRELSVPALGSGSTNQTALSEVQGHQLQLLPDPNLGPSSCDTSLALPSTLMSTCGSREHSAQQRDSARDDVCAWSLHAGDAALTAAWQTDPEPSDPTAPSASQAYVLTRRIASVPSPPAWHAHAYWDSCSDGERATTQPLGLDVLEAAWDGSLALHLLLPDSHQSSVTTPPGSAAGPGTALERDRGRGPAAVESQALPLLQAPLALNVEVLAEWTGLLGLLASVCPLEHDPPLAGVLLALPNHTDWSDSHSQGEGPMGSSALIDAPPVMTQPQPQLPAYPPPRCDSQGGSCRVGGGKAPPPLVNVAPVLSPPAAPPSLPTGALEAPGSGGRWGRALLFDLGDPEGIEGEREGEAPEGAVAGPGLMEGEAHAAGAEERMGLGLHGAPDTALVHGYSEGSAIRATAGTSGSGDGSGQRSFLGKSSSLYHLSRRRGQGHFGEVWQAVRYSRGPGGGSGPPPCPDPLAPCGPPLDPSSSQQQQGSGPWVVRGDFVLKRLLTERGGGGGGGGGGGDAGVHLSGLREVYFGEKLRLEQLAAAAGVRRPGEGEGGAKAEGLDHLVRFVESFQATAAAGTAVEDQKPTGVGAGAGAASESGAGAGAGAGAGSSEGVSAGSSDLWLVFHDEGTSLHDLMYESWSPAPSGGDTEEEQQGGRTGEEAEGQEGQGAGEGQGKEQEQQQQEGASGGEGRGAGFHILGPSRWWHELRRSPAQTHTIRGFMRQLLLALDTLHTLNITHRDVKPENLLLKRRGGGGGGQGKGKGQGCSRRGGTAEEHQPGGAGAAGPAADAAGLADVGEGGSQYPGGSSAGRAAHAFKRQTAGSATGSGPGSVPGAQGPEGVNCDGSDDTEQQHQQLIDYDLRLIDLGSAIDKYSMQHLYGAEGPSAEQLTLEYAPPEALFGRYWEGSRSLKSTVWAHDMWAAGVVWLELLLGTPHVFQLPQHTQAVIDVKLRMSERSEGDRQLLYLLRGMMEWCIYPPQVPSKLRGRKELVSWSCTEQAVQRLIKARDPTGMGMEDLMAVSLLRRLLHWEPGLRPTPHQALKHAFFTRSTPMDSSQCSAFGEEGWC